MPKGDHDWAIDKGHSSVVFRVKHAGISNFYGTFNEISGEVTLDPQAPEKGSVSLSIRSIASIRAMRSAMNT